MRIGIYDLEGNVLLEDELGFHWEENHQYGGEYVKMSKFSPDGENFYGLGDKPMHSNLKGKRVENWNTDEYAFGRTGIPFTRLFHFTLAFRGVSAMGCSLTTPLRRILILPPNAEMCAPFGQMGGEMNYYFIYGPTMKEVVETYTNLTGVPEMPPLWALGYHQCKWSYYPEEKFVAVAKKFRELSIPCDAMYLDIDYMEGFGALPDRIVLPDAKTHRAADPRQGRVLNGVILLTLN